MCDFLRRFTLCTCTHPGDKASDGGYSWKLQRFKPLGEPDGWIMEGIFEPPSSRLGHGPLTIQELVHQLNDAPLFDFDYQPLRGDRLSLHSKEPIYLHGYLSAEFDGKEWIPGGPDSFSHTSQTVQSGKLQWRHKSRLNTLRTTLYEAIKAEQRPWSDYNRWIRYMLYQVEQFSQQDWEETVEYKDLLDSIWEECTGFFDLPGFDVDASARLRKHLLIAARKPQMLKSLPPRRTLVQKEWTELWSVLNTNLTGHRLSMVFEEGRVEAWVSQQVATEARLYRLSPVSFQDSHVFSSLLLSEMMESGPYYWTDDSLDWVLYQDGYGYYHTQGPWPG